MEILHARFAEYQRVRTSNVVKCNNHVVALLQEYASRTLEDLKEIELRIESVTLSFDERLIYKNYPEIVELLIDNNDTTAKDYLKKS